MPIKLNLPPDPEEPKPKANFREGAATATRSTAGTILPMALRLGPAAAGVALSKVPVIGNIASGALSALGEMGAEKIENPDKPINWPRVAVEGGLGVIPMGSEGRLAKILGTTGAGAAKGTALAAAGIAGRKATDSSEEGKGIIDRIGDALSPSNWNTWDLAQLGIGAGLGGFFGHGASPKAPPKAPVEGPQTPGAYLDSLGLRKAEDINTEAARLEQLGKTDEAKTLRTTAAIAKRGNEATYNKGINAEKAETAQEARNLNAADKFKEKAWQQEARNLNARDKYLNGVAKETDKEALQIEKQRMADWMQEAKNANAAEAYNRAQQNASAVERRLQELQGQGATTNTVVTKTSSMETPEGSVKATTVVAKPKKGGRAPKVPKAPSADGPQNFKVVDSKGDIVMESPNEDEVSTFLNRLDPGKAKGLRVINEPLVVAAQAPIATPAPPVAPIAKVPAPPPTPAPQAPKAPEAPKPFNAPRMAPASPIQKESAGIRVADNAAVRGTPADIPDNPLARKMEFERLTASGQPVPDWLAAAIQKDAGAARIAEGAIIPSPEPPVVPKGATKAKTAKATPTPPVPIAPIVHGADLPTPAVDRIESTHPLSDINERAVVTNPSTGRAEPGPGDLAVPGTTLVLQPKTPFGGWLRQEVGPEGITRSETKNVKPIKPNQVGEGAREAFNATQGEAEAENPLLAQLLAQKMKDPNLGVVGDQMLVQSLEAPHNIPVAPTSPSAPAEILNEVESFNQRRMEALNAAKSEAEAQQIAQQMEPEANALQLKLSLAERAASQKGEALSPLLIRAGLGLGGAAIGGAANPDDPVSGAILGGAAGLGGAMALEKMRLPTGLRTPSASPLDRLGNLQRFGLLTNFPNLGVNMVAPVSGSALSSIEKMLAGRLAESPTIQNIAQQTGYDAGDPRLAELGRGGLRAMVNTMKSSWMPHFKEATRLIREAEEGRADMSGGTPSLIDSVLQSPAYLMTAGDVGARTGLHGAGWTEGMAREATLTGEPRYNFTSGIANLSRKGGAVGRLFLPFAKTAANALEGSFERIPVIGLLARVSGDDPQLNASIAELAARQGMGAAVGFAAYEAGKRIDPETTKNLHLNAIITNMGGQYGPLAAAAFAAGQSSQDENGLVSNLMTGAQHLLRDTPLPTGEFLTQLINAGKAYANHEPPNPEGLNPLTRWAPRNMVPRFLDTDLLEPKQ